MGIAVTVNTVNVIGMTKDNKMKSITESVHKTSLITSQISTKCMSKTNKQTSENKHQQRTLDTATDNMKQTKDDNNN